VRQKGELCIASLEKNPDQMFATLLSTYAQELERSGQWQEANKVRNIMGDADRWFVKVVPVSQQADQTVSTE